MTALPAKDGLSTASVTLYSIMLNKQGSPYTVYTGNMLESIIVGMLTGHHSTTLNALPLSVHAC